VAARKLKGADADEIPPDERQAVRHFQRCQKTQVSWHNSGEPQFGTRGDGFAVCVDAWQF
jgi:hypothetical protein